MKWRRGAAARRAQPDVLLAEFASAHDVERALHHLRSHGFSRAEPYTPFPITREDADAPQGWRALGVVVFGAGLLGAAAGYAVQWYANVASYPLNIGGRPAHAVPAFLIASFEGTVLCAAIAAFIGFLVAERLPRLWQPILEIDGFERATTDRFWVGIEVYQSRFLAESAMKELMHTHPLRIVRREAGR